MKVDGEFSRKTKIALETFNIEEVRNPIVYTGFWTFIITSSTGAESSALACASPSAILASNVSFIISDTAAGLLAGNAGRNGNPFQ